SDHRQGDGEQEGQPQRHRLGHSHDPVLHQPGGQRPAAWAEEGTGEGQEIAPSQGEEREVLSPGTAPVALAGPLTANRMATCTATRPRDRLVLPWQASDAREP